MSDPSPPSRDPADLDATEVVQRVADGRLTPGAVVDACLARLVAREPGVQAWVRAAPEHARAQAAALAAAWANGAPLGRLHGVPVGVKDIFDTADMPTENGSPLHALRQPAADAAVVERLRAAGAVILGKTVTTEFAAFTPGKSRNPHDPSRTPGGSSSGSAAAVAAGMVPLALGSQTNGSVIRPASFCGVYGFKPSFGLISRRGMTPQAPSVDHVGVFGRSLRDVALLVEVLAGHDAADPATRPVATPPLVEAAGVGRRRPPRLAFVGGPTWAAALPATRDAFTALAQRFAQVMAPVELPLPFAGAIEVHRRISWAELAHHLAAEHAMGPDGLSPGLRAMIDGGREIAAVDYLAALAEQRRLQAAIDELLAEHDAILTPAAPGEAPVGLETTGSPVFCTLWTLLGTPALSLPLLTGPDGLPLGVQLVGRHGADADLVATAAWLVEALADGR